MSNTIEIVRGTLTVLLLIQMEQIYCQFHWEIKLLNSWAKIFLNYAYKVIMEVERAQHG